MTPNTPPAVEQAAKKEAKYEALYIRICKWVQEQSKYMSVGEKYPYTDVCDLIFQWQTKEASTVNERVEKYCDAAGHYGGDPIPDGICPKCNKPWNQTHVPVEQEGEKSAEDILKETYDHYVNVVKPDD